MTPGEEEVLEEIRHIAAYELAIDRPIEPDDELTGDLQLDSVARLTLVVALEDRFRMRIDDHDASHLRTVLDLVRLVDARRPPLQPEAWP